MYDESSPEPTTQPDTENHTQFYAADGEYHTRRRMDGSETFENYYRRLASLNTGVRNGKWADESKLRRQEKLAIYDAIAGQLELTPYQKRRGRLLFDRLSVSELSSPGGIDTPLVAVCVAAVVVREDGRMFHPSRSEKRNDGLFTALLDDIGYTARTVQKCYEKVLHRVDL